MKLIEIWKRLGKQSLSVTRHKDAVVFVNDKEYVISNIRYDSGKFIGFETKPKENFYIAKEINEIFEVCGDCKNFDWDMPQCKYCNSKNGFIYFERKYNGNE